MVLRRGDPHVRTSCPGKSTMRSWSDFPPQFDTLALNGFPTTIYVRSATETKASEGRLTVTWPGCSGSAVPAVESVLAGRQTGTAKG
jgi:hypothetical protein